MKINQILVGFIFAEKRENKPSKTKARHDGDGLHVVARSVKGFPESRHGKSIYKKLHGCHKIEMNYPFKIKAM